MNFANICIGLGVGYGFLQLYALMQPDAFKARLKSFPRATEIGWVLMIGATAWFLYNVNQENIADFAPYKKLMLFGFGALGVCSCIYLKDFLPVRGLAVLLLLLGKLVCDTGRWVESPLRLIVITWAYIWICAGMWWTVSPWRARDWFAWNIADDARFRMLTIARLILATSLIGLGASVFRG
tara:strand:+ start:163 stop:708 length:546 start_codon:yes stop_codon:yes gene_type:complete